MQNTGFLYYYDLLGLDRDSYRLHYSFSETTGANIENISDYPDAFGTLSSVGNFHSVSGSGLFTGQTLSVANSTGLEATDWTHLFIFQRTTGQQGVLFDSYTGDAVRSGYRIGVNDNNRFYFESYDNNGPVSRTSTTTLGVKNCAAVVKTQDLLTFYCFDFNGGEFISDTANIRGQYTLFSDKITIGSTNNHADAFKGYIDEYVYLTQGLNPSALLFLVSGLFSDYGLVSPLISGYQTAEITGYATGITGVTGIVGYVNVLTGSGVDIFGNPQNFYMNSGVTGYLVTGLSVTPLTGYVNHYITGEPEPVLSLRTGDFPAFGLNEVSLLHKRTASDVVSLNVHTKIGAKLNVKSSFDYIYGEFRLDANYGSNQIQLFRNGAFQRDLGFTVTGDFYNSGVKVSGDYYINDARADSGGVFAQTDFVLFDNLSGATTVVAVTGNGISGRSEALSPTSQSSIYLNGLRLLSGLDYTVQAGAFKWASNSHSGVTGSLEQFNAPLLYYSTGTPTGLMPFPRDNTQFFFNGSRQYINVDYVENSSLDLIAQSGIFATGLPFIYNQDDNFFETIEDLFLLEEGFELLLEDAGGLEL